MKDRKGNYLLQKISIITLTIIQVLMVLFIIFRVYPYKTITVNDIVVQQDTVTPGERLVLTWDYCIHRDMIAEYVPRIVNGTKETLHPGTSQVKKGCYTVNTETLVVPTHKHPGTYHIEYTITYHVNAFRKINKVFRTNDFTVTEPV